MTEVKKQWERFAFYDKAAIEKRLETMAADGWMIEKAGNFRWTYRRIEPKKLHFSVTYFPNASEFDPGPTEGQKQMEEFCAKTGWILAIRWGQMQIFYNEQEDPVPIETDPVTQVETIHRAMKKSTLPTHGMMLLLCGFQLFFIGSQFRRSPVEFLATPASFYMVFIWIALLFSTCSELFSYLHWYRRAKSAAENGFFYEIKTRHFKAIASLAASVVLLAFISSGEPLFFWSIAAYSGMMIVLILIVGIVQKRMKKAGFSRSMNRAVSMFTSVFLALVFVSCMTAIIIGSGFRGGSRPVGTYDGGRWQMDVYADPMPLYVQDLIETDCKDWSTRAMREETFLLSRSEYRERALVSDMSVPSLDYRIIEVKQKALYNFCKNTMIHEREDEVVDGVVFADHYEAIDPTPWGAKEAYQQYFSTGYADWYILCYEDKIIDIWFEFTPTPEQMKIVAEKLGKE